MKTQKYPNYSWRGISDKERQESRNSQIRKFMAKFGNHPAYLELQNKDYKGARR